MQLPVENAPGRMKLGTVRGQTESAGGTLVKDGMAGLGG